MIPTGYNFCTGNGIYRWLNATSGSRFGYSDSTLASPQIDNSIAQVFRNNATVIMALNIVLVEPLIPQNTGSTARLTAATYSRLHLIEPLGFELSDRYLKRAGLDYWPEVELQTYKGWEQFLQTTQVTREQLWFFTTHATNSYTSVSYRDEDYLVFGNESHGLAQFFHEQYSDRRLAIPMENPNVRSINLSNCASIVLYEARRQLGLSSHREIR